MGDGAAHNSAAQNISVAILACSRNRTKKKTTTFFRDESPSQMLAINAVSLNKTTALVSDLSESSLCWSIGDYPTYVHMISFEASIVFKHNYGKFDLSSEIVK